MDLRIVFGLWAMITGCGAPPTSVCSNPNYPAGRRVEYLVSSSVEQGGTFMGLQCTLDVTTSPHCVSAVKFSNCRRLGSGVQNREDEALLPTQLQSYPMHVKFVENDIVDILVSGRDSADTLNVKRAVLLALHTYTLPTGAHQMTQSTVLGSCTTKITVNDQQTTTEIEPQTCDPEATAIHPLIAEVMSAQPTTAAAAAASPTTATVVSSTCRQRTTSTSPTTTTTLSSTHCEQTYVATPSGRSGNNNPGSVTPSIGKLCIDLQLRSSWSDATFPGLSVPSYLISLPYSELQPDTAANNNVIKLSTTAGDGVFGGLAHWISSLWHQLTASPHNHSQALLFADRRIYTFDGSMYQMHDTAQPSGCTYLLSKEFVHNNLTLLDSSDAVTVITGEMSITIETTGKIRVNNSMSYSQLPVQSWNGAVLVSRSGDIISLTSVYGVAVQYDLKLHVFTFSLAHWYNDRVQGLLGSIDDNPGNDADLRSGAPATSRQQFLMSYEISGSRDCRRASNRYPRGRGRLRTMRPQNQVCESLFHSQLAGCAGTVDPEPFVNACQQTTYVNPKQAACETSAAYISLCAARGVTTLSHIHECN